MHSEKNSIKIDEDRGKDSLTQISQQTRNMEFPNIVEFIVNDIEDIVSKTCFPDRNPKTLDGNYKSVKADSL